MGTVDGIRSSGKVTVLVEGALCVALSMVFSYLKLFSMPYGGSITLEMAPLFYFSYRRGWRWGTLAGGLSGLLQMLLGGYVVHPAQAILDYPLAFACTGAVGVFVKSPPMTVCGTVAAGLLRLLCHVLSGVIFFSSYAPEGQNPWAYSIIYNVSFLAPSLVMSGALAWALWRKFAKNAAA
ncbi:MAG: energy-coupled thiamine transporter ThiT [Synergistaceae bacterium]|jgi:thiamine transporter|nr:energy-coupled thiamine transporter ThiT [Synergistaceae bacterium]